MQNSINNRQMVFLLFTTLIAITSVSLPQIMAASAGTGAWVPIMLGSIFFGLVTVLIVKLNSMFPGKVLYEYSGELIGKPATYIIALFYIVYFFVVSTFLCVDFSQIVAHNFLPKSPQWAELVIGIPVFGYIAYKGVTNTARLFEIIGLLMLVIFVLVYISMFLQGDLENIFPLFNTKKIPDYLSASQNMIVPLLGMEILTVIPFTAKNKRSARIAFFTLIGVGVYYVLSVYACYVMIRPSEIIHYKDPLIEALHLVEYRPIEFLNRVDIFYLTFGLAGVILGKSVVIMAIVEYINRMFPKLKRGFIVIAVCIIVFILSLVFFNMEDFDKKFVSVLNWAGLVAALLIPLALFVIAKVKKHAAKTR